MVLVVGVVPVASVSVAESGVGVVEGGAKSGLSCMLILSLINGDNIQARTRCARP